MSTYVFIFQAILCAQRKLLDAGIIKGEWRYSFWWMGFISAASIFIEKKQRRSELALYVLGKMAVQDPFLTMLAPRCCPDRGYPCTGP